MQQVSSLLQVVNLGVGQLQVKLPAEVKLNSVSSSPTPTAAAVSCTHLKVTTTASTFVGNFQEAKLCSQTIVEEDQVLLLVQKPVN